MAKRRHSRGRHRGLGGTVAHNFPLLDPPVFVIAPFANLGDLLKILLIGISNRLSTFCKS